MGCRECMGIGVLLAGIMFIWVQIIYDLFLKDRGNKNIYTKEGKS